MPPLSTHLRLAVLVVPPLGIILNAGYFLLGTTAPDAFEPDSETSFSRHHFRAADGRISLPDFLKVTNFITHPSDDPTWSFACGYYCHLWLDIFYRNNADRLAIRRPAGMPDAELRRLVRREAEILNAPFVLDVANRPVPQPEDLLLPIGLEFIDPARCIQLFHEVIRQSREWSILPIESELIDRTEYTTFLEDASKLFLNKFQIAEGN